MEYSPEEYTRHYIVQALFKLMHAYDFENIKITDITRKAGVGRATFYRYFKSKQDVILYYFEHITKEFKLNQRYIPRCKADYIYIVKNVLTAFKNQAEPIKLIRKARLEHIYLDYLNKNFVKTFEQGDMTEKVYSPYIYAGMLFNVSMKWLDNGCTDPIEELAEIIINAIYFKD